MCGLRDVYDYCVCDYFVCGLSDESIQRRLLSEVNLHVTLTEVLTVAQSVERAQKELKEIHLSEAQSENHSVN